MCMETKLTKLLFILSLVIALSGCSANIPDGSIVITQVPVQKADEKQNKDILDALYPPGSRVVILEKPYENGKIRIVSKGFYSAGSPYVSWDGRTIYFIGKKDSNSTWQIYSVVAGETGIKQLTDMQGGACSPSLISDGSLSFISPVPPLKFSIGTNNSSIYLRTPSGEIKKLSYSPKPITDLTVLNDGRILFVSWAGFPSSGTTNSMAIYVINNDGTEVTKFALENDGAPFVRRPREINGKKVVFLASLKPELNAFSWAEKISLARPFLSRTQCFAFVNMHCSSIENLKEGGLLACFMNYGATGRTMKGTFGVYKLSEDDNALPANLYDDPSWHEIEAVPLEKRQKPMGRMSSVMPDKKTGNILCLDANYHRSNEPKPKAAKVRVLTLDKDGKVDVLGWSEVEKDGSFLIEVPCNTPIGFETCDSQGKQIYRVEPLIWVRPGENRSCLGCHEPYNRAPKNFRPLAANSEAKELKPETIEKKR